MIEAANGSHVGQLSNRALGSSTRGANGVRIDDVDGPVKRDRIVVDWGGELQIKPVSHARDQQ